MARAASWILGTLFSQMTIESTARDPSTAAELTPLHAASCELRDNLPNLFPRPSFYGGYVRLGIHSRAFQHGFAGLNRWVARTLTDELNY